jgi:hypothetical protein
MGKDIADTIAFLREARLLLGDTHKQVIVADMLRDLHNAGNPDENQINTAMSEGTRLGVLNREQFVDMGDYRRAIILIRMTFKQGSYTEAARETAEIPSASYAD